MSGPSEYEVGRAIGSARERERIVSLLEAASDKWRTTDYDAHYGAEACLVLIKGEDK